MTASLFGPRVRQLVLRFHKWWYGIAADWFIKSVPVVAACLAVAVQVIWGNEPSPVRVHGALAAALLTAVAVVPPVIEQATTRRVVGEAIERLTHDFNRTLVPLSISVRSYCQASGAQKGEERGSARVVALTAASSLLGSDDDIRATVYEATGSTPTRMLTPVKTIGRPDEASYRFDETTQLGAEVFGYLDADNVRFCGSIDGDPTPGYQPPLQAPIWKSFVSAPVMVRGVVVGMLTVDSKLENGFSRDEDPDLLRTIANLLAVTWKP